MYLYKTNKKVISVKGHPARFLNGITSNGLDQPSNAFLNIHGRIIATFDQVMINDNEMWLCIEQPFVGDVLGHIDRFAKLSKAEVLPLEKNVYYDVEGITPLSCEYVAISQEAGRLIVTDHLLEASVSEGEFTLFRLKNNLPLHGIDYRDEMPLNVSAQKFVSFTKGCYLGQEPISKVHHRSKPTWRLVVKYADECGPEEFAKMTSKTIDSQTGKEQGFVFVKNV